MSYELNGTYNQVSQKWQFNLAGEIDIASAHLLKDELESAYNECEADMSIDISELTYMDSTGLGVIISLYSRLKDGDKKFTLVNPRDNVKKLLKITQFDKVLC